MKRWSEDEWSHLSLPPFVDVLGVHKKEASRIVKQPSTVLRVRSYSGFQYLICRRPFARVKIGARVKQSRYEAALVQWLVHGTEEF